MAAGLGLSTRRRNGRHCKDCRPPNKWQGCPPGRQEWARPGYALAPYARREGAQVHDCQSSRRGRPIHPQRGAPVVVPLMIGDP